jgi:hypothetical protein
MWTFIVFMAVPLRVLAGDVMPLNMDTIGSKWAIGVDLEGEAEINEYAVDINVESVRFVVPQDYKYDQTIESVSFGLSKHPREGSRKWDTHENSNVMKVNETMSPGGKLELSDLTFRIPVQDMMDIDDKWLTLQIEVLVIEKKGKKETRGYVYAHSDEEIFQ